jgi:hypothetical protein
MNFIDYLLVEQPEALLPAARELFSLINPSQGTTRRATIFLIKG